MSLSIWSRTLTDRLKTRNKAMNVLLNDKVQQVIISVGMRPIYLFSQTKKHLFLDHINPSEHSLEELVDTLIESKYKLVDARYFRDPSITGNLRLMLYTSNHALKEHIPGAATILQIARGFAGCDWKVCMAYTPYYGSSSEDGHTVLNIHLMPRHYVFAVLGLRLLEGGNRLRGRFA